jgi:hypothetical protein
VYWSFEECFSKSGNFFGSFKLSFEGSNSFGMLGGGDFCLNGSNLFLIEAFSKFSDFFSGFGKNGFSLSKFGLDGSFLCWASFEKCFSESSDFLSSFKLSS